MLLFLLLVLAVFLARVGSAATMCFFLFLLRFFCVEVANIYNLGELPFGWAFFHLFTFFFWLVCCACFWFAVFLLLPALTNIVVRVPVSTLTPSSRAPR